MVIFENDFAFMSQVRHGDFRGSLSRPFGGPRGVLALALAQIGLCVGVMRFHVLCPVPVILPPPYPPALARFRARDLTTWFKGLADGCIT
jgi:hypothetical protein